jgi:hypothetical protein
MSAPLRAVDVAASRSDDFERELLGCLLSDPRCWESVANIVRTDDFARADHRLIFSAIAFLVGREETPSTLLVVDVLHRQRMLEAAGGSEYIAQLVKGYSSSATVSVYAARVREHSDTRRLLTASADAAAIARERGLEDAQRFARQTLESLAQREATERRPTRAPLDFDALQHESPPPRDWAEVNQAGMGWVTLVAGAGGVGKSTLMQQAGSHYALGRDYIDRVPTARRVLIWNAEDDSTELWRRQLDIARWLDVPLSAFAGRLFLQSYEGEQIEVAALVDGHRLVSTPMYRELCQQIGDYRADVVVLDNIARLFAGSENDRHQVTSFVAMLAAAARPTSAAVLLVGHPGKAAGSEYSGSTAWEGAVRARLYFGRTLPDVELDADRPAEDENVRYLCKRKANYSARDWRRLVFANGVFVPEQREAGATSANPLFARAFVRTAIRKLAKRYGLLGETTPQQFARAMVDMRKAGELVVATVGKYANRSPREGLVLASEIAFATSSEAHK